MYESACCQVGVFLLLFFLLAAFLRGGGSHGWMEDGVVVSPFLEFCFSSLVSS
jgi:hypothetical protein